MKIQKFRFIFNIPYLLIFIFLIISCNNRSDKNLESKLEKNPPSKIVSLNTFIKSRDNKIKQNKSINLIQLNGQNIEIQILKNRIYLDKGNKRNKSFFILNGKLKIKIGERNFIIKKNDLLFLPKMTPFEFVPLDKNVKLLIHVLD